MKQTIMFIFLIFLVSCAPSPTPEPQPQPESVGVFESYLPYISTRDCPDEGPKQGLAWGWRGRPADVYSLGLCSDFPFHTWTVAPVGEKEQGTFIPMVGYQQFEVARSLFENIPRNYDGLILFGNECDLSTQCNRTPFQVGDWLFELTLLYPEADFTTPMYSNNEDGKLSLQAFKRYVSVGGDPDRLVVVSIHIYPDGLNGNPGRSAKERLDDIYNNFMVPAGLQNRPIWVTEIGWRDCYDDLNVFREWMKQVTSYDRVEVIFGFTPHWDPSQKPWCPFSPFFEWEEPHDLTEAGAIFSEYWKDGFPVIYGWEFPLSWEASE